MWTKELIAEAHEILDEMSGIYKQKPVDPDKMDEVGRKIAAVSSWGPGEVDRQGGSFTDSEIIDRLTNWH